MKKTILEKNELVAITTYSDDYDSTAIVAVIKVKKDIVLEDYIRAFKKETLSEEDLDLYNGINVYDFFEWLHKNYSHLFEDAELRVVNVEDVYHKMEDEE